MYFFWRRNRLIMTLLVRDEDDVLEENIKYHLSHGVDHIIATDNGSVDGTKKILKKYESRGNLTYLYEGKLTYEQDKWVSRMAKMAVDKLNATHIIHCDADEFWVPKCGNLKKEINKYKNVDLVYVPVRNYLPPIEKSVSFDKFKPNNFEYFVKITKPCPGEVNKRKSSDLLMYTYPMKIITNSKITEIGYGNDSVRSDTEIQSVISENILIHHYPIRSWGQFQRKVENGGSAFSNNPVNSPSIGWHWKSWYKKFNKGKLKDEYDKLSCKNKRHMYINKGILGKI